MGECPPHYSSAVTDETSFACEIYAKTRVTPVAFYVTPVTCDGCYKQTNVTPVLHYLLHNNVLLWLLYLIEAIRTSQ